MGWKHDKYYRIHINDLWDLFFVIRKEAGEKFCLYENSMPDSKIYFDSLEESLEFDIESYAEKLREKNKKYNYEYMKANYNKSPSKVKRYYIYEIDSGLFLGKNNHRQFFLNEEPLQTFTMSQASVLKGYFHGLYLFDWLLIEA